LIELTRYRVHALSWSSEAFCREYPVVVLVRCGLEEGEPLTRAGFKALKSRESIVRGRLVTTFLSPQDSYPYLRRSRQNGGKPLTQSHCFRYNSAHRALGSTHVQVVVKPLTQHAAISLTRQFVSGAGHTGVTRVMLCNRWFVGGMAWPLLYTGFEWIEGSS
jgi:hypothetical protein